MTPEQVAKLRNLPPELQAVHQWCICGPDRAPYVVSSNGVHNASIHKRDQWKSFEQAIADAVAVGAPGIGFMLTYEDPWTCVDLDVKNEKTQAKKGEPIDPSKWTSEAEIARYKKMVDSFDTYTERSSGGYGLHIWARGAIGCGARREGVEVYSQERFMVFTGDVLEPARPIAERQELLELLVFEIRKQGSDFRVELEEVEEDVPDDELFDIASRAANKEKFDQLCAGKWKEMGFPSQSEADLALMSMLTFYSKSNEQCRRIFRCTALGQREKATKNDRYLNFTLEVIRGRQKREAAISDHSEELARAFVAELVGGSNQADVTAAALAVSQTEVPQVDATIEWPPGLTGAIASFIYSSSPRPVKEVAIVAALGLLAGICGKAYNIPQSGLNAYIILVARSGIGKEAMHSGVALIMEELRQSVPASSRFVDFGDYASGPALKKAASLNPSFLNVCGEFGKKLKRFAEDNRDGPMSTLRTCMTDLYQKSGASSMVGGINYSDKEKNVGSIAGVAYSLIGETTPGTLYESLTQSMMEDGFLSRFTIIDYPGDRPDLNEHQETKMLPALAQALHGICAQSLTLISRFAHQMVTYDQEANALLSAFNKECDAEIRSTHDETYRQMWNRAHLKVLRFAALLAVADNCLTPVVSLAHAKWALSLIRRDIKVMSMKISSGDVGIDDATREKKMLSIIEAYLRSEVKDCYGVPESLKKDSIVPKRYLQIRLSPLASFKNARNGSSNAIDNTIRSLIESGYITEIDKLQMVEKHAYHGKAYRVMSLGK